MTRAVSGDEGARTLNPRLAKAVLSQLSYVPVVSGWGPAIAGSATNGRHRPLAASHYQWAHEDSNFGPRPYQGRALTN